ncbi:MAG TPA: alpha/beta hydrolase [Vicinamibacterales bacterium]|nr:alpha/beta hydrolase [Vicinamibacterales bacterium]
MYPAARRVLVITGVVLLLLVLIGATYQGVATALERRRFPHPGRMVDAGGHQLHLYCQGQGTPTVVLEAPATTMSAAWAWVQMDVAKLTRVCSYDRAGLGWSEAGDAPFAPEAVAPELNALLSTAAEPRPVVMAGAELGAALATLFAARYPNDTAALVLVNPPGAFGRNTASLPSAKFVAASPWLARAGVLRAMRTLSAGTGELPQPAAGILRTFLNRPDHLTRGAGELARWDDTVMLSEAAVLPRGMPVTQVEVEGQDRVALLANRRNAQDVSDAIAGAVRRARSRQ